MSEKPPRTQYTYYMRGVWAMFSIILLLPNTEIRVLKSHQHWHYPNYRNNHALWKISYIFLYLLCKRILYLDLIGILILYNTQYNFCEIKKRLAR